MREIRSKTARPALNPEEETRVKKKWKLQTTGASIITKLVILILIGYLSITLLNIRSQIRDAESQYTALQTRITAQTAENAVLEEHLNNRDDPQTVLEIAKEKLGLVEPGEIIFYDTTN